MYHIQRRWTSAKKTEYDGSIFDSKFEAQYAKDLNTLLRAHKIKKWERQVRIPLEVNGYHICNYYIDFVVYHNDDTIEYVECKGWPTPIWKLKWLLFEALYSDLPNTKLTIVQQGNFKKPKTRRVKK